ncbi:MAG: hypothetical protein FWD46_01470 [Cystobacterineae bacterium]|nr:hypothetical protein [Cystobacterineae bacterium]
MAEATPKAVGSLRAEHLRESFLCDIANPQGQPGAEGPIHKGGAGRLLKPVCSS